MRAVLFPAILFLVSVKLWTVSHDELRARGYPGDDPWYVISSTNWYWSGSYSQEAAFQRQPGYPLWIALSGRTGIPLRIATELLFLASGVAFVAALRKVGLPGFLCVLLFALIVFHPFSIHINNYLLVDSLYAPMLLFSLAGMIMLLSPPASVPWAVLTGLALAVLWHTRQETVLIEFYIALLFGCALWVRWNRRLRARGLARELGIIVVIPAAVVLAVSLVTRAINYRVFGVFAEYELAMPNFREAYRALLRIEPDRPIRYVSVPREVRRQAYEVSPTFRLLQPHFEGSWGRLWEGYSRKQQGIENEIATSFFPWALAAVVRRTVDGSAAGSEQFYRSVASEIDAACDDRRLRCRSLPLGVVDPHLSNWLPHIPSSLQRMIGLFFWPGEPGEGVSPTPIASWLLETFNRAANRRASLIIKEVQIAGWVADRGDALQAVSFRDLEGNVLAYSDALPARSDVDRRFGRKHSTFANVAFNLTVPFSVDRGTKGSVVFTFRSGRSEVIPYRQVLASQGRVKRIAAGSRTPLEYTIQAGVPAQRGELQHGIQLALFRSYGRIVKGVTVLAVAALLGLLLFRRARSRERVLPALVVLLFGVIGARLGLLTLVDASSWPANHPRFLFPIAYLYPCMVLILTYYALRHPQVRGVPFSRRSRKQIAFNDSASLK